MLVYQRVFLASQDQSPIWDHPNSLPWNTMDELKRFQYIFHNSYQLYSTRYHGNIMTYDTYRYIIYIYHIDTVYVFHLIHHPYHSHKILHFNPPPSAQRTAHLAPFWVSEVPPGAERSRCPHWSCPVPPSASLDAARCGTSPWKAPAPAGDGAGMARP